MSLDRLEITPLSSILGDIVSELRSGYLAIVRARTRRILYFSQGELVMVTSDAPEDSLADLLVRRKLLEETEGQRLAESNPVDLVLQFHDMDLATPASRQSLLREWVSSIIVPLFSLDEGTAIFTQDEPLDPEKRIFVSTPGLIIEGVRSISNGLILRRSLGDMKREIALAAEPRYAVDRLPLLDPERAIAESLRTPQTIEAFLRNFAGDSLTAARVVIAMMVLGVFAVQEERSGRRPAMDDDQMQKDLQLLATIGSGDARSLQAVALARQLPQMDHYRFLDVPRAAVRAQITGRVDELRKKFDRATYPAVVREYLDIIHRRIDEAFHVLSDVTRRNEYDKLIAGARQDDQASVQQRLTRRSIAEQNFRRAQEMSIAGDYWGAIVLLRQAVNYTPDHTQAWFILGTCLEQNPNWRREAIEAFQRVLSLNPDHVEAMLSLGDLYRNQGMLSRAIGCYEDALQVEPENPQAKSRLKAIGKKKK